MNELSDKIQNGAKTFLRTEYKYLAVFVFVVFVILLILYSIQPPSGDRTDGIRIGASFLAGALLSALAGWQGMIVATDANVRTTQAADKEGLAKALRVAFTGGAVMGFTVVGLGLLGVSLFYFLMTIDAGADLTTQADNAMNSLAGFGFGASSIALFARVAGGIYTKAADVGADLVGKVEMDIPEDDPRNPAVIADNVGDNVGDVAGAINNSIGILIDVYFFLLLTHYASLFYYAQFITGMGADLFESYVGSIIAAATLANGDIVQVALPFWIAGAGIVASIIGFFFVRTKDGASQHDLLFALHKGTIVSSIFVIAFSAIIVDQFYGSVSAGWKVFGCIIIGLFCGIFIGQATEYFTSYSYWPVKSITKAGITGPATVIIQGIGIGMVSCVAPVTVLVITILACK